MPSKNLVAPAIGMFLAGPALIAFMAFLIGSPKFLPSPTGTEIALGVWGIFGSLAFLLCRRLKLGRLETKPRQAAVLRAAIGFTYFGIVGLIGCIATINLEGFYTRAEGVTVTQQAVVTAWRPRMRSSCAGPEFTSISAFANPPCMNEPVPVGTVLSLGGRQSRLGFQIAQIDVLNRP